jgi:hypothetical protein
MGESGKVPTGKVRSTTAGVIQLHTTEHEQYNANMSTNPIMIPSRPVVYHVTKKMVRELEEKVRKLQRDARRQESTTR